MMAFNYMATYCTAMLPRIIEEISKSDPEHIKDYFIGAGTNKARQMSLFHSDRWSCTELELPNIPDYKQACLVILMRCSHSWDLVEALDDFLILSDHESAEAADTRCVMHAAIGMYIHTYYEKLQHLLPDYDKMIIDVMYRDWDSDGDDWDSGKMYDVRSRIGFGQDMWTDWSWFDWRKSAFKPELCNPNWYKRQFQLDFKPKVIVREWED